MYCSLRQLLEVGFFHADPHPGNLVVTSSGSLAYFDFGMMGDIPRHYRVGLIQVVRALLFIIILGHCFKFCYLLCSMLVFIIQNMVVLHICNVT